MIRRDGARGAAAVLRLAVGCVIVACVTAVWWGALDARFVFDDVVRIVHAEERFAWPWSAASLLGSTQRPLVDLTLAANHAVGSLDPRGYHAFNIAVHALVAALLALVTMDTIAALRARGAVRMPTASDAIVAVTVALVWALHPLQTSAATYVIQRAESMAALGTVAAIWFLLRAARGGGRWTEAGMVLAVLGALLSKPTAVSLPFVLLAFDSLVLSGGLRLALRARPLAHALSLASLAVLVALGVTDGLWGGSGRLAGFGADVAAIGPLEYAGYSLRALGLYLAMLVQPSLMAIDRGPDALAPAWCLALGSLGLAGLVCACWFGRSRWWGVLPWSFLLLLAPTTSIVPLADAAVDHRMYLPSAVITASAVAAAVGMRARVPSAEAIGAIALAAVVALEVRATVLRNRLYADPIALWGEVIAQSPRHARGYINRAGLLLEAGRTEEAERDLDAAAALQPGNPVLLANRAILALVRGDAARAESLLSVVTARRRSDAGILGARGDALRMLGRHEEALGFYALASVRAPSDARYPMLEANTLADLGRDAESIAALERARARTNEASLLASIAFNTGNAHFRSGRRAAAAAAYREALAHDPTHTEAWRWLEEADADDGG